MIIIIVSKPNSGVDLEQGLGHGSGGSTRFDLSQYKNKSHYYHSFKAWLVGRPEVRPGSI
jgi:hypothetical protein